MRNWRFRASHPKLHHTPRVADLGLEESHEGRFFNVYSNQFQKNEHKGWVVKDNWAESTVTSMHIYSHPVVISDHHHLGIFCSS